MKLHYWFNQPMMKLEKNMESFYFIALKKNNQKKTKLKGNHNNVQEIAAILAFLSFLAQAQNKLNRIIKCNKSFKKFFFNFKLFFFQKGAQHEKL